MASSLSRVSPQRSEHVPASPMRKPSLGRAVLPEDISQDSLSVMYRVPSHINSGTSYEEALNDEIGSPERKAFNPLRSPFVHRSVASGLLALSFCFWLFGPKPPAQISLAHNAQVQMSQIPHNDTAHLLSRTELPSSEETLKGAPLELMAKNNEGVIAASIAPRTAVPDTATPASIRNEESTLPPTLEPLKELNAPTTVKPFKDESVTGETSIEDSSSKDLPTGQSVTHIMKPKETLSMVWRAYGAPSIGGAKALEAFIAAGVPLKSFRPGDELIITRNEEENDIIAIQKKQQSGDAIQLIGSSKKGYSSSEKKISLIENERTIHGTITKSFAASARNVSVPYAVIDELVDLFGSRVDFRKSLKKGDSFAITYLEQRNRENEARVKGGKILAASITTGGKTLALVRYTTPNGATRYYDETGSVMGNYFLRYPVQFSRISSKFSSNRLHPVLGYSRAHNGVDFAASVGTPVRTVADGVVVDAGRRGGAGILVKIAHNSRYSTAYLHLSKIAPKIRPGTRVKKGQVIGAVGMTGIATGPHLHFSLYENGRFVDPMKAKLPSLNASEEKLPQKFILAALKKLGPTNETKLYASLTAGKTKRG